MVSVTIMVTIMVTIIVMAMVVVIYRILANISYIGSIYLHIIDIATPFNPHF